MVDGLLVFEALDLPRLQSALKDDMGYLALVLYLLGFGFFYSAAIQGSLKMPENSRPSRSAVRFVSIFWPFFVVIAFLRGDL